MTTIQARPPVVVVMGHIDHGKSTLLDYIRKTNVAGGEAGGITQHISAYEVHHGTGSAERRITFLDTPGHAAFSRIRSRGAAVADVAILVVSAEDGVMPQTLEALKSITEANIPYVVAINKIDSPKANADRTKQSMADHSILVEEWGGPIPCVEVSAKTGENIQDLLDMVLLVADIQESVVDTANPATGVIIEAHRDVARGISATVIIKDGTLSLGDSIGAAGAVAPVRIMENFKGERITTAIPSSPVNIIGWSDMPDIGSEMRAFASKKQAEDFAAIQREREVVLETVSYDDSVTIVPLVVKSGVSGTIEAIASEIAKINNDRTRIVIVSSGAGTINEADVKRAMSKPGTIIAGFGTTVDPLAQSLIERTPGITLKTFSIIYDLVDWLTEIRDVRTRKITVEETIGELKILKTFNWNKNLQVFGGRVTEGELTNNSVVHIIRDTERVGRGTIKQIQKSKSDVSIVHEGDECGMALESKTEVQNGDHLRAIRTVEK